MNRELDIIQTIAQLTGHPEDLADDAYWNPATRQILTTDMLVENHHFSRSYCSPEDIGWKAIAVNVSDIAGMGGSPQSVLVSLGLPASIELGWIERLYQGILAACRQYGCALVGGDTVGSDCLVLNVTAVGTCPEGRQIGRRTQAQAGDLIIATGYHGLSEVGLRTLQAGEEGYIQAKAAHLRPQPRLRESEILSRGFPRYALMDSSDGLADALLKIALASRKKLIINRAKIPLHPELRAYSQAHYADPVELALYGGEDFQLVATVPEVTPDLLAHFHVLGRVEDGEPGAWLEAPGQTEAVPLDLNRTYQHFAESESHD
jgi:thiamine-monophosphate kinase